MVVVAVAPEKVASMEEAVVTEVIIKVSNYALSAMTTIIVVLISACQIHEVFPELWTWDMCDL